MGSGMKLVAKRLQLVMRASASECQAGAWCWGERMGALRVFPGRKVGLWEMQILQGVGGRDSLDKGLDR